MLVNQDKFLINKGVKFVEFEIFSEFKSSITAVFSTRIGGISKGVYESMNLSFTTGDSRENVLQNFALFSDAINTNYDELVLSSQYHNNNIRVVTKDDMGKGMTKEQDYKDIDGLVTNVIGIPLVTFHADCSPIYIYDPLKNAIGLAHAGWKGTSLEICGEMIEKMIKEFSTDPKNLKVVIGPSICGECYEIGDDVKSVFDRMSLDVSDCVKYNESVSKYYLNIPLINRKIALDKGVLSENIQISNICTKTNLDTFFSHRGHGSKRGGQAAVMQLK